MSLYLVALIITAVMAALLTRVVRDLASNLGLAFAPNSARHIHDVPVPRLGGVAIFLTCLIISLLYWAGVTGGWIHQSQSLKLFNILVPATGLFLVGLIDDLRGIRAGVKLAVQVVSGAFLYFSGYRLVCLH